MKTKTIFNKILWIIAAVFVALFVYMESAFSKTVIADETRAATTTYTDVLEDLKKDENFDESKYYASASDYTMSLITIAEGKNTELFVYVHQPSYEFTGYVATSINVSRTRYGQLLYNNYGLRLVSTNGVFQKYVIENAYVWKDSIRYYDISSIFRAWNSNTDDSLDMTNDNTITERAFKVAKLFTFVTDGGKTTFNVQDTEVIEITDKYVGFVQYEPFANGLMGNFTYYDSHFLAFSTDRKIDELLEADVFYKEQIYEYKKLSALSPAITDGYSNPAAKYAYLTSNQTGSYDPNVWFSDTEYEWPRISTVSEFIENIEREYLFEGGVFNVNTRDKMTAEGLTDLCEKQWVLRFYETGVTKSFNADGYKHDKYSIISNVSILRLKFKTNGQVFNLGVVDNKQTGNMEQDNEGPKYEPELPDLLPDLDELWARIQEIMKTMFGIFGVVVVGGLLLCIALPILPHIINLIAWLFKWIFKALWWVISFPFNLIGKLFNRKDK